MTLLIGSWTIGLILALLALGVFVSFRIFAFPDITADGSLTLGASVAAALIAQGHSPWAATVAAVLAGALAGGVTGGLHTRFQINGLLSGILVATALYSVNLHVMGRSNIPLLDARTVSTDLVGLTARLSGGVESVHVLGRAVPARDAVNLAAIAVLVALVAWAMYLFFRTSLGTAMRATGDNPRMIRALGADVGRMITVGLMISNGLVALAGALLAQYQGFTDVQMGIGMIVTGLASVILGQALVGSSGLGLAICGAVMGSLLFRLMVALALRWGLNPNDLKLITAGFVFVALVLPKALATRLEGAVDAEHLTMAILAMRGVFKTFFPGTPDEVRALRGLDLSIEPGTFVVVIGTNGSGKSTTLNAVAGSFPLDAGTIELAGRDITLWAEYRRAKLIGRVFQDPLAGTSPGLSIAENLALAARRGLTRGLGRAVSRRAMAEFRDRVRPLGMGLEDRLDNPIGSLSGGQRQALTLLMATYRRPELLLLDEHTAALDPRSAEQVIRLTEQVVRGQLLTTMMVTHSMAHAASLGDRLVMVHQGRVIFDASGAAKQRLRPHDLLEKFEELRRWDQLDESAAQLLREVYV